MISDKIEIPSVELIDRHRADGQTPLLDVAEKVGLPLGQLHEVAEKLAAGGLLDD